MNIGMDMDGVLADFYHGFSALFPQLSLPELPTVWDWPEEFGATDEEVAAAWATVRGSTNFWEDLAILPDGQELLDALNQVRQHGHEVYFLTQRFGPDVKGQTWRWLKRHGYTNPTVLIAPGSKAALAEGLDLQILVDDKPGNLENLPETTRGYLVDYPHNHSWEMPPNVQRVGTGLDALKVEGLV